MAKKLTPRQQHCINIYFSDEDPKIRGNASAAGKKAGFAESTYRSTCTTWFNKNKKSCPEKFHHVWEEVNRRRKAQAKKAREKYEVSENSVLEVDAAIANADIAKLFNDDGSTKKPHEIPEEIRKAISRIEVKERVIVGSEGDERVVERTYKYALWDRGRANERLGRTLGIYIDKKEMTYKLKYEELEAIVNLFPKKLQGAVRDKMADLLGVGDG